MNVINEGYDNFPVVLWIRIYPIQGFDEDVKFYRWQQEIDQRTLQLDIFKSSSHFTIIYFKGTLNPSTLKKITVDVYGSTLISLMLTCSAFTAEQADLCLKTAITLGLLKGRPSYRRSLTPSKENIQRFNQNNTVPVHFLTFFLGHFCPPGSGSGSSRTISVRIHADPDPRY
jgi:hypothetical protein